LVGEIEGRICLIRTYFFHLMCLRPFVGVARNGNMVKRILIDLL
jgi:hypothetical protein